MCLSIIILPLLSSFMAGVFGHFFGRTGARILTVFGMTINLSFVFFLIFNYLINPENSHFKTGNWITSELLQIHWSFTCDALTLTMFFVVNLISLLVHVYSSSYMSEDPHLPRFMSYLSLFTFFMLLLVSADNLLVLFLGWEGVGICSFLLIGFWFTRINATRSALKALFVNRIADIALTLGIILCFCVFRDINLPTLFTLTSFFIESTQENREIGLITLITLLFFLGAMGKSAQIFLHTWLPDAMEGPTPVSALIHAATMVTAGVFLIIKCSPMFEYAPTTLILMTWIGGLTALFSSLIGLVQYDMKKVIAYSTCSQLGYMVFACGLSAYQVSLFHLTNHAIFKALLFLSAGSIIHSLSNEQDMRRMGGLTKLLPVAYAGLIIGSLALIGFPFLTGYYSKDVILEIAYSQYNIHGSFIHWLGTITAFFTSFYSFRLAYLSFIRKTQMHKMVANHVHESDLLITLPLIVLILGSIFFGYITKDLFIGIGSPFLNHVMLILPSRNSLLLAEFLPFYIKNIPFFFSLLSLIIFGLIYLIVRKTGIFYHSFFKDWHKFLSFKWYFDLLYNTYVNKPLLKFGYSTTFKYLDKGLLEIFGPEGLYKNFSFLSYQMQKMHTGIIYYYAAYILLVFLFFITLVL